MISFFIKTWSCECGYKQDFEPTEENVNLHFNSDIQFKLSNLRPEECPSCALSGTRGVKLKKESDAAKKSKMEILNSSSDLNEIRASYQKKPLAKIRVGFNRRQETDKEKVDRIDKELEKSKLSLQTKTKIRTDLFASPNLIIDEEVMRLETDEEKECRIQKHLDNVKIASLEEIKNLRAKYEDA